MSLFSSILGGQGATPIGNPQQITTTEIPKQLAPYYTDILGKAQALYNKRVEEGYKPYEGPTIAQYTPEQEATFAGIAGLQGQVAPKFAEAEQMTRDAAGAITGAEIQEAMSPYQQAVTDIEKRQAQKSYEQNVLPKVRAAQIAQGSFGGTRGTLLEAQSLGDQQQVLADIQSKGSAAAFKDARAALDAQRLRQGQGATQLANLAPAALSNQLKELGAQQTVGETKQRQAQTALDEAYRQFQLEKQEPYDAMSKYQSVVTGAPLGSTQYAPPAPPPPSLGQTLLGGATTAAGLYGAFTGNNPLAAVGLMGKKEGGGLSDLPVIKANTGNKGFSLSGLMDKFNRYNTKLKEDAKQRRLNEESYGGGLLSGKPSERELYPNRRTFDDTGPKNQGTIVSMGPDGVGVIEDLSTNKIIDRNFEAYPKQEDIKKLNIKDKDEDNLGISSLQPNQGPPKPPAKKITEKKSKAEMSDYEKKIRAREDAYLKMIAGADKRFTDRAAAAEKQGTKSKYMQLANLGLNIMSGENKGNIVASAADAAKKSNILGNLQAINEKALAAQQDAEDKIFAARTGLAKEELGVELNREERDQVREAKAAEKKFNSKKIELMEKELKLKERELEMDAAAAGIDTKDFVALSKEIDTLLKEPGMIKIDGRNFPKNSQTAALMPQEYRERLGKLKDTTMRSLVQEGNLTNFYSGGGLARITEEINKIYTEGLDAANKQGKLNNISSTKTTKASSI